MLLYVLNQLNSLKYVISVNVLVTFSLQYLYIYPSSPFIWGKVWRGLCKYMKLQCGRNSLRLCERSCWDRYMFTRSRRRSWVCSNARYVLSRGSECVCISFFSLFYRSICISIRHRFILTWISEKLVALVKKSVRR